MDTITFYGQTSFNNINIFMGTLCARPIGNININMFSFVEKENCCLGMILFYIHKININIIDLIHYFTFYFNNIIMILYKLH